VQLKRPVEIVVGRVKFLRNRKPKPDKPQRHPRRGRGTCGFMDGCRAYFVLT
jgi:hypothetical protein